MINEQRKAKLQETKKNLRDEALLLQEHIYDNANPSPVLITILIVGILFLLWLLYIVYMKNSMSGSWYDSDNRCWDIHHNKFSDELRIEISENNGKKKVSRGVGSISGSLFKYEDHIGLWNHSNIILFVNGGGLVKLVE